MIDAIIRPARQRKVQRCYLRYGRPVARYGAVTHAVSACMYRTKRTGARASRMEAQTSLSLAYCGGVRARPRKFRCKEKTTPKRWYRRSLQRHGCCNKSSSAFIILEKTKRRLLMMCFQQVFAFSITGCRTNRGWLPPSRSWLFAPTTLGDGVCPGCTCLAGLAAVFRAAAGDTHPPPSEASLSPLY